MAKVSDLGHFMWSNIVLKHGWLKLPSIIRNTLMEVGGNQNSSKIDAAVAEYMAKIEGQLQLLNRPLKLQELLEARRKKDEERIAKDLKFTRNDLVLLIIDMERKGWTYESYAKSDSEVAHDYKFESYVKNPSIDFDKWVQQIADASSKYFNFLNSQANPLSAFFFVSAEKWCVFYFNRTDKDGDHGPSRHIHYASSTFLPDKKGSIEKIKNEQRPTSNSGLTIAYNHDVRGFSTKQ
jgi:hypothetical protein